VSRGKNLTRWNPVDESLAISMMAAYPDIQEAKEHLEQDHGYEELSEANLKQIKGHKAADLEEARRELAPLHESKLTNDMLDEARKATSIIDLAIRNTQRLLERDVISDPAKAARDLGQLRTQSIDKRLALEGRPTAIIEKRSAEEILSKLEALGVAKRVDVTVEED
jgi:hypothetical protein